MGHTSIDQFSLKGLFNWLTGGRGEEPRTSLREEIFSPEYGEPLRGDSSLRHRSPNFGAYQNAMNAVLGRSAETLLTTGEGDELVGSELTEASGELYLATFFRHRRFEDNNGIWPRGGVTFFIELNPSQGTFAFSYALCSLEDNFDKTIGRTIAKNRFDAGDWYEIKNYKEDIGVVDNIKEALHNLLYAVIVDEETDTVFSSLSDGMVECELKALFKRI